MFQFTLNSRVHPMRELGPDWFVKRDDELSCTISGSKIRKYTSLLPWILKQDEPHVSLIGGHNSNNVLGLSQLLLENGITPHAYVREAYGGANMGLLSKLLPDDHIHVVKRDAWPPKDVPGLVIPEGAFMQQALPGAKTLGLELQDHAFDHVFVDAGTGMQAIGLILSGIRSHIHVLLLADSKEDFLQKLDQFEGARAPFSLYYPSNAKSFGSKNATLQNYVADFPKKHGFFVEPIYSGKLFYEAERIGDTLSGTKCIVHSGGIFNSF